MSDKDIAVQKLQDIYVSNGFITSDQIFDVCDELDISIFDTDYVMNKVASLGILVSDTAISADDDSDEKEEVTDYAQVDYNKIYNYFLSNYPAMKQIIDVAKSTPPIQHKEPSQLFIQIRSGNSHAKDILFRKFIRVALRIAYNYRKRTIISLEDIFQEACIGVLKSIEVYNPHEHSNFTSYCSTWIMQSIDRYIADHESIIRVPVHAQENETFRVIDEFIDKNQLLTDTETLKILINEKHISYKDANTYLLIHKATQNVFIYDIYESIDDINIADGTNVEEQVDEIIKSKEILATLDKLPEREREVLRLRFGLISGYEYTLEEIGVMMNVTRERIRQMEAKALRRLRNPALSKTLHDFL